MNIFKKILLSFIVIASILSLSSATSADDPSIMVIANEKGAPASLTMKELKQPQTKY